MADVDLCGSSPRRHRTHKLLDQEKEHVKGKLVADELIPVILQDVLQCTCQSVLYTAILQCGTARHKNSHQHIAFKFHIRVNVVLIKVRYRNAALQAHRVICCVCGSTTASYLCEEFLRLWTIKFQILGRVRRLISHPYVVVPQAGYQQWYQRAVDIEGLSKANAGTKQSCRATEGNHNYHLHTQIQVRSSFCA